MTEQSDRVWADRYAAPRFDPRWDLKVSSRDVPPPDGQPLTIRTIDFDDGSTVQVPNRLYIQVAPDTTAETRAIRVSSVFIAGEEIPRWHVTNFERGRQVVIDTDVDEAGKVEIRAVTIYRPDGPLSPPDVTKGLRLHEWTAEGFSQAVAYETAVYEAEADRYHPNLWSDSVLVGRSVAERIRHRPPPGRGTPPPPEEMKVRAGELSLKRLASPAIARKLAEEFPDEKPRSARAIRRWLQEMAQPEEEAE